VFFRVDHKTSSGWSRIPSASMAWSTIYFPRPVGTSKKIWWATAPRSFGQFKNLGNLVQIGLGDGGVDLKFDSRSLHIFDAPKGGIEGAVNAPEFIVESLVAPSMLALIRRMPEAAIFSATVRVIRVPLGAMTILSPGGRHAGEVENIITEQGFPAGEDDDGFSHLGDFIQQFEGPDRVQFSRVRTVGGRGPAVNAGEVAVSVVSQATRRKGVAPPCETPGRDSPLFSVGMSAGVASAFDRSIVPAN
jgi:hypothetical protein